MSTPLIPCENSIYCGVVSMSLCSPFSHRLQVKDHDAMGSTIILRNRTGFHSNQQHAAILWSLWMNHNTVKQEYLPFFKPHKRDGTPIWGPFKVLVAYVPRSSNFSNRKGNVKKLSTTIMWIRYSNPLMRSSTTCSLYPTSASFYLLK